MKGKIAFALSAALLIALLSGPGSTGAATGSITHNYGHVTLSGGFTAGHFPHVWDLTACELKLSFTYDATGLVDDFGGSAHAWSEIGLRQLGYGDFNPTWINEGAGVWLATDYDWSANTFDPDPVGAPSLDLDDKLILQKGGGIGENAYNLPSAPSNPWANYAIWFDRDGVDSWQAKMWGAEDGITYNTGGRYQVVITLSATGAAAGKAYMTVNGESQGFYELDWHSGSPDLMPAGMTFSGDMTKMQVFYGLYGYGATHRVSFENITVTGCLAKLRVVIDIKPGSYPNSINLGSNGLVPVAIISAPGFDATQVNPDSVTLAGAGIAVRGKGNKYMSHPEDVNGDGLLDLVIQVETTNLDPTQFQDGFAFLNGTVPISGIPVPFEGYDEINIIPPGGSDPNAICTTIQDGSLLTSDGLPITAGFDRWGYNYQAHLFNGFYCDAYRDAAWCQPYKDIGLMMKWNDAWLSNKDCDGDGLLDRHYGFSSYRGSGAWLTNHQWGGYQSEDGNSCMWNYFVKIIAAPADAELRDGIWYTSGGTEIGPAIWGEFAIIQEVYNDPCEGSHGPQYISPDHPGFGGW